MYISGCASIASTILCGFPIKSHWRSSFEMRHLMRHTACVLSFTAYKHWCNTYCKQKMCTLWQLECFATQYVNEHVSARPQKRLLTGVPTHHQKMTIGIMDAKGTAQPTLCGETVREYPNAACSRPIPSFIVRNLNSFLGHWASHFQGHLWCIHSKSWIGIILSREGPCLNSKIIAGRISVWASFSR